MINQSLSRGKTKNGNKWITGSYLFEPVTETSYIVPYGNVNLTTKILPEGCCYAVGVEVIPETVGRYTGIHDKNGRKIFEKDIVLTQEFSDKPYAKNRKFKKHIGVVEYKVHGVERFYNHKTGQCDQRKEYGAEWIVKVKDYGKYVCSNWGDFFDCEVIGNLYDDPQLLEEEKI